MLAAVIVALLGMLVYETPSLLDMLRRLIHWSRPGLGPLFTISLALLIDGQEPNAGAARPSPELDAEPPSA